MEPAAPDAGGVDRISALPDDVLGEVISFLPSQEAGRAAMLARRWRKMFGRVHSLSFVEEEEVWRFRGPRRQIKNPSKVLDNIGSALLCRRRCAGSDAAVRTFRFALNSPNTVDVEHMDDWIRYVLDYSAPQLHIDIRLDIRQYDSCLPIPGGYTYHAGDSPRILPRLFSCVTLKVLRISHCRLNLPVDVNLPMLETLHLSSIRLGDSGSSVERLVSSCPCLADLKLEAIPHLRTLSVIHTYLRWVVIRCCHNATSICINASALISFEFRGAVRADSLLNFHNFPEQGIRSFTIAICGRGVTENPAEHAAFGQLLQRFYHSERLHVHHGCLHPACLMAPDWFPQFPRLTRLVLQGPVSRRFICMLRFMLEQAPNLLVLVLLMASESTDVLATSDDSAVVIPNEATFSIPCLRLQVREIHLVSFEGSETHTTLARLLLQNALVLHSLNVVFTEGTSADLKEEIEGWAGNVSERTFSCFGEG